MNAAPRLRRLLLCTLAAGALAACAATSTSFAARPSGLSDPYAAYLAPSGTCNGSSVAASRKAQFRAMVCLVNFARRKAGLSKLRSSALLDRSSKLKAQDIVRCADFSHTPCGESFYTTFNRVGYLAKGGYVGENIYFASLNFGSPRAAFYWWLHSDPHRHNLLTRNWRDLGLGRVRADGVFAPTQTVVWVMEFGRRP